MIDKSIKLDDFVDKEIVCKNLINPIEMLDYQKVFVNEIEQAKIKNGVAIQNKTCINVNEVVILIYNDIISAVGIADGEKILIKKVF